MNLLRSQAWRRKSCCGVAVLVVLVLFFGILKGATDDPRDRYLWEMRTIGSVINEFYLQNKVLPPLGTNELAVVLGGENKKGKNYLKDYDFTVTPDGVFLYEKKYRMHAYTTVDGDIVVVLEALKGEVAPDPPLATYMEYRQKLVLLSPK